MKTANKKTLMLKINKTKNIINALNKFIIINTLPDRVCFWLVCEYGGELFGIKLNGF